MKNLIESVTIDGTTYYSAEWRGVSYSAHIDSNGQWCVHSRRLALGQYNIGSWRHFKDIQALTGAVRALAGLMLVSMPAATAH